MEPLLDKLARQKMVKGFFATFRGWDKRSDEWVQSMKPGWRISLACVVALVFFFGLLVTIVAGPGMLLLLLLLSCIPGYIFLLPNLCLILCLKRGWHFRLVNFGVFLAYLVPMVGVFFKEALFDKFSFIIFLFPIVVVFHFIYLTFAWQKNRTDRAWKIVKFVAAMLVMTAICSTVWDDHIAGNLYNDSDDNMFGFLLPGTWVSDPIVSVDQIVPERSMSDPDEIKKGWSVAGLWGLWFSFIAVSLVISTVLAWLPWVPWRLKRRLAAAT